MEIKGKIKIINEEDYILFESRDISTTISGIKEKHFSSVKIFKISINYFKKISKEKTFVEFQINKKLFELVFDYKYLSSENKKENRRGFSSNLLDEIFQTFFPIVDLKFFADNLNFTGPFTMINISKNFYTSHKMKNLELNNFVFNNINTENEFLTKIKDLRFENIVLSFSFDKFDSNLLTHILENIVSKNTKKIYLTFIIKYFDTDSFIKKQNITKNYYFLNDFKLNLIKFYPDKSVLVTETDELKIKPIALFIMENFWPGFIEVNFSEIIPVQIKMEIKYIFRYGTV